MKYSEFPYERVEVETQKELMAGWLSRFEMLHQQMNKFPF